MIYSKVVGIVDWFDFNKGFGFVDIEVGDDRAYFQASTLTDVMQKEIGDWVSILCDVGRAKKGPSVTKIYKILDYTVTGECKVVRLYDERGYGFVTVDDAENAFFHYSIFSGADREKLVSGYVFSAFLRQTVKGLQVSKIVPE